MSRYEMMKSENQTDFIFPLGDSGGPLISYTRHHGKLRAVTIGVVSRGTGCANFNLPGVFSQTAYHLNWIRKITQPGSCRWMFSVLLVGHKIYQVTVRTPYLIGLGGNFVVPWQDHSFFLLRWQWLQARGFYEHLAFSCKSMVKIAVRWFSTYSTYEYICTQNILQL